MDATSDAEGGARSLNKERSPPPHQLEPEPEQDSNESYLLVICLVVGGVLLLLFIALSLSLLCLYKRRRLNWFQNDTLEAETDRLRSLTTGSHQTSTSAAAAAEAPSSDGNKNDNGEQTGSRLIPKFLFSSGARSTNQNATGSGYGTIPVCTYPSGIGFPVATKVSYVLLSNKSVESPESTPTSPDVDAARTSNEPNSRFRNRSAITGSQPPRASPLNPAAAAVSAPSPRSKVMGTLASRGSNPNASSSTTVASSPCRIVVDAVLTSDDPSPSDLNSFVDSSASATGPGGGGGGAAESRRSSYSSVLGGGGDVTTDSASRRGSMSPRERSSIPFLWTLGPSNSAPSVGKEDSFWVPPNVLLKKRANSLAPPSLTITADVDCSSQNGINSSLNSHIDHAHTHTRTHTDIYLYIFVYWY